MLTHLVWAAIPTVLGLGLVAVVCKRWFEYPNTLRNFSLMAVATVVLVAIQSSLSHVTVVRCRSDPSQFCEYNDSVPIMSTTVASFALLCLIRSWTLYDIR